ncbi:MAG TPA: alpha-amylase family glycosyl hydrolase [Ignavibacteriaceae bacterium]|nr:alpha-amylase family glycosyl hydrolase [Ignavibacteriaceae bacterium]
MNKNRFLKLLLLIIIQGISYSQISIKKIEPPNWWIGLKHNKIQLMVYGENLNNVSAAFNNEGIKILRIHNAESSLYCFIDIEIPENLPEDNYKLKLFNGASQAEALFPILSRNAGKKRFQGFSNKDVIYLIMPDRFSNGDASNDNIPGFRDSLNRKSPIGRHGGDIQGIINKLDYLKELGITAIWINPLVENNTRISYHGYSATDFYKIDPRFGTNELYKILVEEAHDQDLKIILDHVSNHCSIDHPWLKNLPFKDWINGSVEDHLPAMHHKMIYSDIHADSSTMRNVSEGWFVNEMPDLNQKNIFVANYIIQNTIWWIEYTGLDGIREDTYPYIDQKFAAEWGREILYEYPGLNIVGEVWTGNSLFLADYQTGNKLSVSPDTYLPSVTDFEMRDSYYKYLSGTGDLYNIYETLSKDFIYPNPDDLLTFIDNHDLVRGMLYAKGDIKKVELALAMLLTTRGIPQILYGTEIAMIGGKDDGTLRSDFPGGFPGDSVNAFITNGRTPEQNEMFNFLKDLLNIRKKYPEIAEGKMIHFPPENGIYVYFKILNSRKIMIAVNDNNTLKEYDLRTVSDQLGSFKRLINIMSDEIINLGNNTKINLRPMNITIYKLEN